MQNDTELIEQVRQRIEHQHKRAIEALNLLSCYFSENPVGTGAKSNGKVVADRGIQPGSQRDKIGKVLDDFKAVDEISSETGLSEGQVRGCLYSKDFELKIEKRRIKGRIRFRLKGVA